MPSKAIMTAVGLRVIEMIEDNIRRGESYDGTKFRYSERPFAMPAGATRLGPRMKAFIKDGRLTAYMAKGKRLWVVIPKGYKDLRSMRGQNAAGDFLTASGRMLRNLQILSVTDTTVKIGFSDPEQEQKALWLNVTGVGRSRRLWRFLGLSPQQQDELAAIAAFEMNRDEIEKLFAGV
ncbi:MAG TPA: hypothetical protein PLW14_09105 [Chlorobiota bacterium]|nr:hypothetical protein [Chlorobiota bacterium]